MLQDKFIGLNFACPVETDVSRWVQTTLITGTFFSNTTAF